MDGLNKTLNNLSLYEVKAYVRKAQNVVLSLTEMEAKVREATNNEPWGAPSSLMQQIAAGTYNYREREEIINMIFRRFTEKSAHEWRQIYKALQLLEYIVKNGSEKFVDDARANVSIIQMLKSFHYIDSQGRDQGVNVRNRAKQLIALLNDEAQIRQERKKARQNQKKFGGVAGGKSSVNPNSRFTGTFDDEEDDDDYGTGPSFGGYQNRVFGDGGVYGERFEEERPAGSKEQFEEYEVSASSGSAAGAGAAKRGSRSSRATTKTSAVNATATAGRAPEVDLFALDGPAAGPAASAAADNDDDDDDFDDFQSAGPSVNTTPAPARLDSQNLASLFSTAQAAPAGANTANLFQAMPTQTYAVAQPVPGAVPTQPSYNLAQSTTPGPAAATKAKNDAFSSLFSSAKTHNGTNGSRSASAASRPAPTKVASHQDDLFGSFTPAATSNNTPQSTTAKNDELDLLSF